MENPAGLTPSETPSMDRVCHGRQYHEWTGQNHVRERTVGGGVVSGSGEGEAPPRGLGFFESLLGRGAAAGPPACGDQLIPGPSLFSLNSWWRLRPGLDCWHILCYLLQVHEVLMSP